MKRNIKLIFTTLFFILFCSISYGQKYIEKKIVIGTDTLAYFDTGKGKTTLLFIHGSFINKDYWKNQIAFFSKKYRVITVDLAGHGNSTHNRTDWTIQNFGNDIKQIIAKLSLKKVILIGHSVGADIMLETVNEKDKAIIGIIGIDYFKNVGANLPQNVIDQVMTNLKTDFTGTNEQYVKQALISKNTKSEIGDKVLTDFKAMNKNIGIAMNESFLTYTNRETELLKKLPLKLFLINVDYVPTNIANLKEATNNNFDLQILNGSCHYPMIEISETFNLELDKTISKIKK